MVGYWLSVVIGLGGPSIQADTILLNNGGQIKGTIIQLRFSRNGETITLDTEKMGEVSDINASPAVDEITFEDEKWEGRIIDLKMKTIGGALVFERAQFSSIEKKLSERERLSGEYTKKLEALGETDAIGWFMLASWAGQNKLLRQEREAAQRSLEIDPDHAKSGAAHLILGHVQKDGQWLTATEVKELEKQAGTQKAEEMRAKGFVQVGSRWVSQEDMDRIKALKERIDEITQDICREAENWAESKLAGFKQEVERLQEKSSDSSPGYESARILRASHAGDGCSTEIQANADMKRYKDELKDLANELKATKNKVGTAANALRSKVSNWKRDIKNEGIRLVRRAEAGEEVDVASIEGKLRPSEIK